MFLVDKAQATLKDVDLGPTTRLRDSPTIGGLAGARCPRDRAGCVGPLAVSGHTESMNRAARGRVGDFIRT
jgi:hypothetical protein